MMTILDTDSESEFVHSENNIPAFKPLDPIVFARFQINVSMLPEIARCLVGSLEANIACPECQTNIPLIPQRTTNPIMVKLGFACAEIANHPEVTNIANSDFGIIVLDGYIHLSIAFHHLRAISQSLKTSPNPAARALGFACLNLANPSD